MAGEFRADVQGLRAVAVLLVVAYHARVGVGGGFVGVDVFFVVSGFVITRMLLRELDGGGTIRLRTFYLRRIRRLLPALALVLAVSLVGATLLLPLGSQPVTGRTGVAAALFNANHYLAFQPATNGYFTAGASGNALIHLWSLSVEEQLYLVLPSLVLLGWWAGTRRRVDPRRTVGIALALITAVSWPLCWLLTTGRLDPRGRGAELAFYSAPTRAWEFAAGGLLAVGATRLARTRSWWSLPASITGASLLAVAVLGFDDAARFPGAAALVPVAGTVLLIAAGSVAGRNPVTWCLSRRPLGWLGDRSYSWYLWHWPIIVFTVSLFPGTSIGRPVAAAVSLLPAWLSYRYVERPIRTASGRSTGATLRLGVACMVVPILAAGVLHVVHGGLSRSDVMEPFAQHISGVHGCDSAVPLDQRTGDRCRWPIAGATGTAVLVGDSNAAQFSEPFIAAAHELGLDAEIATLNSCPFDEFAAGEPSPQSPACRDFVEGTIRALVSRRPELVVISTATDGYLVRTAWTAEATAAERSRLWTAGLTLMIEELQGAGIRVVVVHEVPRLHHWRPAEMSVVRSLGPVSWRNTGIDRAAALAIREPARAAEAAAAIATGARTLDVFDDICPGARCSAFDGSIWLFKDEGHITTDAASRLTPRFVDAMTA